jgi:hypothetical protein
MNNHATQYKKAAMAAIFSFLLLGSINVAAQKSVYDVIPGSGPKKSRPATNNTSLPNVIRGDNRRGDDRRDDDRRDNDRVYRSGRRTHLPPGQAKKIYGGSARDYAPGQVKKREHGHGNRGGKKGNHGNH